MYKTITLGLSLFIAVILFPLMAKADDNVSLTIAISNWAPYKDENLPNGGIVTDVTRQALTRAGYDVEIVVVP